MKQKLTLLSAFLLLVLVGASQTVLHSSIESAGPNDILTSPGDWETTAMEWMNDTQIVWGTTVETAGNPNKILIHNLEYSHFAANPLSTIHFSQTYEHGLGSTTFGSLAQDGNQVVVVGTVANNSWLGARALLIFSIDPSNGNVNWSKVLTISEGVHYDTPKILVDPAGNFVVGAALNRNAAVPQSQWDPLTWPGLALYKITPNGTILWDRVYRDYLPTHTPTVLELTQLVRNTTNDDYVFVGNYTLPTSGQLIFLTAYDVAGNRLTGIETFNTTTNQAPRLCNDRNFYYLTYHSPNRGAGFCRLNFNLTVFDSHQYHPVQGRYEIFFTDLKYNNITDMLEALVFYQDFGQSSAGVAFIDPNNFQTIPLWEFDLLPGQREELPVSFFRTKPTPSHEDFVIFSHVKQNPNLPYLRERYVKLMDTKIQCLPSNQYFSRASPVGITPGRLNLDDSDGYQMLSPNLSTAHYPGKYYDCVNTHQTNFRKAVAQTATDLPAEEAAALEFDAYTRALSLTGTQASSSEVFIFDVLGRTVFQGMLQPENPIVLPASLKGVHVVRTVNTDTPQTLSIFIN